MKGDVSDLVFVLDTVAPLFFFPAAAGAAVAGVLRRKRTAAVFLVVAVAAVVLPIAYGIWNLAQMPPEWR